MTREEREREYPRRDGLPPERDLAPERMKRTLGNHPWPWTGTGDCERQDSRLTREVSDDARSKKNP
jgi:hypothetical protein